MDVVSEVQLHLVEEDDTLSITTIEPTDLSHIDRNSYNEEDIGKLSSRRHSHEKRKITNLASFLPHFSFESIFTDIAEIVFSIRAQLKQFPSLSREARDFLNKVVDTAVFYEENLKLLSDELDGEIPGLYDEGALHTFLKLIAITWYRVKLNLNTWVDEINSVSSGISHLFKSVLSVFHSGSSTKLKESAEEIDQQQSSKEKVTPSQSNFLSSPGGIWLREISDRHFELEQFVPLLPLIFLLLTERKKAKQELYKDTDRDNSNRIEHYHLEAFQPEDADRFFVSPFWWKYNPNLQKFNELLFTLYASIGASKKASVSIKKYAATVTTAIKCTIDPNHANKKTLEIQSSNDLDINILQRVWNLLDVPWIAAVHGLTLPSVSVCQNIVIPPSNDGIIAGMPIHAKIISSKPLPFKISHLIPTNTSYVSSLTRVISVGSFSKLFSPTAAPHTHHPKVPSMPLILHFHGGGFVSGSPTMHENYLREWAILTGITIISVDYRLSPEYKFPIAIEECYHVYKWLVTTTKLGMTPSKICVAGDSAGGNLTAAITIKAIQDGIRVPDGICLAYPALDMCKVTNVSRMLFKNDPLVPLRVLMVCRQAYLPNPAAVELNLSQTDSSNDEDPCDPRDPIISPIHVSDEILLKFPPVFMISGEFDPLLDENVHFSKRLKAAGKLEQFKIYEGFPHGFLSLWKGFPEAAASVQETANWMKEILSLSTISAHSSKRNSFE